MKELLELKRRLTWLWRLASCSTRVLSEGKTRAVWLYDTMHQPDGAVLRTHVTAVGKKNNLNLTACGPDRLNLTSILRTLVSFFSSLSLAIDRDFDRALCKLVVTTVSAAKDFENSSVLIVGSTKGTFARAIISAFPQLRVWEIQHGLLDPSYFPLPAERFFARSSNSAALVQKFAPTVKVEQFFDCLEAPSGSIVRLDSQHVSWVQCFSKNPGGGCSEQELVQFEASCANYAYKQGLRFSLHLHPRDNIFKLIRRHKKLSPVLWVALARVPAMNHKKLLVSAYSSALVSNSRRGDLVLNIDIGKPGEVVLGEYSWLPTMSVSSFNSSGVNIDVFLRAK